LDYRSPNLRSYRSRLLSSIGSRIFVLAGRSPETCSPWPEGIDQLSSLHHLPRKSISRPLHLFPSFSRLLPPGEIPREASWVLVNPPSIEAWPPLPSGKKSIDHVFFCPPCGKSSPLSRFVFLRLSCVNWTPFSKASRI